MGHISLDLQIGVMKSRNVCSSSILLQRGHIVIAVKRPTIIIF